MRIAAILLALVVIWQQVAADEPLTSIEDKLRALKGELDQRNVSLVSLNLERASEIHEMSSFIATSSDVRDLYGGFSMRYYLNFLTSATKEANCGRRFVDGLMEFHWNYVIGALKDENWDTRNAPNLPGSLRRFFIRFASNLVDVCANELANNLKYYDGQILLKDIKELTTSLGPKFDQAKLMLVDRKDIKSSDNFILLWQAAANKLKRSGLLYYNSVNDFKDNKFSTVRSPDPSKVWKMQDTCRYKLRPVYQETVLPLMNLIDMGYGFKQHKLIDEDSGLVKDWFYITQLCELILPVEYLKDSSLKQAKVVDSENGLELVAIRSLPQHPFSSRDSTESKVEPRRVEIQDQLGLNVNPEKLEVKVRLNIKSRAAISRRVLKNVLKSVMRHPVKSVSNLISRLWSKLPRSDKLTKGNDKSLYIGKPKYDILPDADDLGFGQWDEISLKHMSVETKVFIMGVTIFAIVLILGLVLG